MQCVCAALIDHVVLSRARALALSHSLALSLSPALPLSRSCSLPLSLASLSFLPHTHTLPRGARATLETHRHCRARSADVGPARLAQCGPDIMCTLECLRQALRRTPIPCIQGHVQCQRQSSAHAGSSVTRDLWRQPHRQHTLNRG
jgi:hypothetical protein